MDMSKHDGIIYAGEKAYKRLAGNLPVTIIKHDYLLANQVISFDPVVVQALKDFENTNRGTNEENHE